MMTSDAASLLHLVGYLTGAALYAMLLGMVAGSRGPAYRLMIGTALLGLTWNLGELSAHLLDRLGLTLAADWMAAASYGALGLLTAVAVHTAGRGHADPETPHRTGRAAVVIALAYASAAVAAVIQLVAAATGGELPSSPALVLMTVSLAILTPALILTTRRQPHLRRALWMAGLAFFAASALHLSQFHGTAETWPTELLGHHASIPLAFAILYQDYRFAFADLFIKRALTFLILVTVVVVGWSLLAPSVVAASDGSPAVGILLALWVATALGFPWLQRQVSTFVDRVVLKRTNYAALVEDLASAFQRCTSEEALLHRTCSALRPALSATSVAWRHADSPVTTGPREIVVPVADDPQYVLQIGPLAGGRRVLSDDTLMLERVALLAGRRIDALRLGDERYDRMLREREIGALATEAELRALRAQINPHFLFNALTTIGYLIQNAPSRAVDTLMRLTTLLRSVLRSEGEFTMLGHERELIECYLQIERERFEERLDARVDIPAALAGVTIPSLIVQPLVENAIKHGIGPARGGGRLVVSARLEDDASGGLRITVTNTGAPLRRPGHDARGGIGLQNVERRLACYYGDTASLTLTASASGETVAELVIPSQRTREAGAGTVAGGVRR